MFNLHFTLRNPWSDKFKVLKSRAFRTPFKYKFIELELYKDSTLISVDCQWTIRQSHAGFSCELGIVGYCAKFAYYDSRHWDYDTNKWFDYTEDIN